MIIPKLLNFAANWPLDELCIRDKDAFVSYRVVVTLQGSRLGNQRIGTPTKSDLTCHLQPGGREGGWGGRMGMVGAHVVWNPKKESEKEQLRMKHPYPIQVGIKFLDV